LTNIAELWTDVETGELIDFDLETYPLEIKTDSLTGDDSIIEVTLYEESGGSASDYVAYIDIIFGDEPTYLISSCVTSDTVFSTTLPSEQEKIWTITKTNTTLTILCNGIEVVEVIFSAYTEACQNAWSSDVEKIMFSAGNDTASDGYRQVQG